MGIILLIIYFLSLSFILLYSLIQLHLIFLFWSKKRKTKIVVNNQETFHPLVTIQLPIYNELYVVERLIDSVCQFDYPLDRLEIQILDDSTDETSDIIAKKVSQYKNQGIKIQHIQRSNREGFKAGALAYGLKHCKGEFIAVFDADFVPNTDFLSNTLAYFKNEKIGVVQTRWEHLNEHHSFLTEMQALALDAHFSVEQLGRNLGNHFINFNGTAGLWRRECIESAGGWQADTLTEDLDLSYRAQLKGWEFRFLEHIGTPAELPVAMNALKSQQFRWTKGAAECARKNLGRVLRSKDVSPISKLHAIFHLLNSGIFICVFLISILSVPLFFIKLYSPEYNKIFSLGSIFFVSTGIVTLFFWTAYQSTKGFSIKSFLVFAFKFPIFLAVSMGLALHNGLAVVEGYIGKKTPFIRTPKFNIEHNQNSWQKNRYLKKKIHPITIIEVLLTLYFSAGIGCAFYWSDFSMFIFHCFLVVGYGLVSFYSLSHLRKIG
ncbi:MAG: glycosyltransferase [Aureispira sp.]|nr:glycosyltransferase [Aureispira sp.]